MGTVIDQTDEELVAQVKALQDEQRRHRGSFEILVTMFVHGFDADPRELWKIPEVRAHFRRLVDFGFIAILMKSGTMPALGGGGLGIDFPGMGAFEVWAHGQEPTRTGRNTFDETIVRDFELTVLPAAERALQRNLERFAHVPANPDLMINMTPGSPPYPQDN
jgi:hypothetical protein